MSPFDAVDGSHPRHLGTNMVIAMLNERHISELPKQPLLAKSRTLARADKESALKGKAA